MTGTLTVQMKAPAFECQVWSPRSQSRPHVAVGGWPAIFDRRILTSPHGIESVGRGLLWI